MTLHLMSASVKSSLGKLVLASCVDLKAVNAPPAAAGYIEDASSLNASSHRKYTS